MAKKATRKKTLRKAAKTVGPRRKSVAKRARKAAKTTKAAKTARSAKPTKRPKAKKPKTTRPGASARPAPRAKQLERPKRAPGTTTARTRQIASTAPTAPTGPGAKPKRRLTRSDIEQFRAMLLEKRAELVGDVDTLRNEALKGNRQESSGDLSTMPIHMAELGSDNYELEFTLGLIEGGRAVLQEINEALERIRQGAYGICLATGKPIGKARLRAKPWAKYCYEHELAQETGQRS